MTINEKAIYLKGLADGLNFDKETAEGKLIAALIDLCADMAKKLDEGKTFSVITAETGASSATIGRVNKCLSYGTGGYRKIIDRLKNESDESK